MCGEPSDRMAGLRPGSRFAEIEEAAMTDRPARRPTSVSSNAVGGPFDLQPDSEAKGGGAERRAIANHAQVAAFIGRFGAGNNVRLERHAGGADRPLAKRPKCWAQHGAALSKSSDAANTHVIELITAERRQQEEVSKLARACGIHDCVLQDGNFQGRSRRAPELLRRSVRLNAHSARQERLRACAEAL